MYIINVIYYKQRLGPFNIIWDQNIFYLINYVNIFFLNLNWYVSMLANKRGQQGFDIKIMMAVQTYLSHPGVSVHILFYLLIVLQAVFL